MRQFELLRVLFHHLNHAADFGVGHAGGAAVAVDGRQVMIGDGEVLLRPARGTALHAKLIEGEERLAFIDQVEVDVQQLLALRRNDDDVIGPYLLEQRSRAHCSIPSSFSTARFSS
jgi:hypothetical protein